MTKNGNLSTNQRKAMEALLSEPTIRAAAKAAGIGERTIHRYLKGDPDFRAELRRRQGAIIAATTAALTGLGGKAIETLQDILDSETANDAVKVRAALGWLRERRGAIELDDLLERIEAIEERLEGEK